MCSTTSNCLIQMSELLDRGEGLENLLREARTHTINYYHNHKREGMRGYEGTDHRRDDFKGHKLKIPKFHDKNGQDAYLGWEKNLELVFDCQRF
ncbi:unnamed protein product [Cochlearia groenlandica]